MSTSVPPPGFVPLPSGSGPGPVDRPAAPAPGRVRRPSRRRLIAAGLGLAAALVATFLVFGSSSNPTVNPIAQAATVSSNAPGFRMHLSVSMTSSAFSGPITAVGDAVVDPRDHAASMSFVMDFSSLPPQATQVLGGTTMNIDMIMDGQEMYLKLPPNLLAATPALGSKPWLQLNLTKVAGIPGLSSLGDNPGTSDPRQMLQYLRAASDGVSNEGQQQVDGVATTHYHAELSLDRLTANVPPAEQDAVREALLRLRHTTGSSEEPIDVWVDAHQLVRRMAMSISLHVGAQSMQESIAADMTDYGPQPRPALPSADQVQDARSLLAAGGVSG